MTTLPPGYVKWDGIKYILDPTLQGPPGPQGPVGPPGPPQINVQNNGTTLAGGPFTTINLSGGLTAVNSGSGVATVSPPTLDPFTSINAAASPYTVGGTDLDIGVVTSSGAVTINLPLSPATGRRLVIMDASGLAGTNNITIQGNGHNINAASSLVLNTNYAGKMLIYNGAFWNIIPT